jgi:subtilisin-like proprotein convertase family protein
MKTCQLGVLRVVACFLVAPLVANAATFSGTGPGGPIPDGLDIDVPGAAFVSTITVPATFTDPISNVWLEFDGLSHTWAADLHARLVHPDGITSIDLFSRPGRGVDDEFGYSFVEFDADNSYSFSDNGDWLFTVDPAEAFGTPVIPSDDYRATTNPNPPALHDLAYNFRLQYFREIFGGKSAVGDWTLEITDWAEFDSGSLDSWTLNIRPVMPGDEVFKFVAHPVAFGKERDGSTEFGSVVAMSGTTAIIGSPFDSSDNLGGGQAHLFDLVTGQQVALLPLSEPAALLARFGTDVAIDGNTAIVGAPYDREGVVGAGFATGSVSQFDVSDPQNPIEVRKLIPADATGDYLWQFGIEVDIEGNLALIGAPAGPTSANPGIGQAYLFDLTTGEELARFSASDGFVGDGFGGGFLDGNLAYIPGSGPIYVYDVSDPRNPIEIRRLPNGPIHESQLSGNLVLIGVSTEGTAEVPATGAAYLYDSTTGQELSRIVPSDPGIFQQFGKSVALYGDIAVIGATGDGFPFPQTGAIYLFDISDPHNPVELRKIKASDAGHNDQFGWSLAFDGRTILVGATELIVGPGSVYVFRIPEPASVVLLAVGLTLLNTAILPRRSAPSRQISS